MANIKLGDLYLSKEESKDIIKLIAKKISIKNYESKSSDKLYNIFKKQSKNRKRIDDITEELKNPTYNILKSESKDIKRNLYNIEKQKKNSSKRTSKYLDELDKRILKLDKYPDYDDYEYKGIKDTENLFKISIDKDYYKPKLSKSGYNKNYVQYESKGDQILTLKVYLNLIEMYLKELKEEYKQKGEWKVQLTIEVNFISLKPGSDETRIMYTRSDNIEIMFGDDNDDIIEQLFESLLRKYEANLQNKMKGSEFEFDGVNFLYYDFHKKNINRGGSYIDSPKWLKDKKSTINPKNNDDKCCQYTLTLALNLDKIKKDPQRVSKIKPYIEKYNWEDIDFPSTSKDWKKFECNNEVALNILYVPYNTTKINIAYKSKNNLTQERQIILLIISDGQKRHY